MRKKLLTLLLAATFVVQTSAVNTNIFADNIENETNVEDESSEKTSWDLYWEEHNETVFANKKVADIVNNNSLIKEGVMLIDGDYLLDSTFAYDWVDKVYNYEYCKGHPFYYDLKQEFALILQKEKTLKNDVIEKTLANLIAENLYKVETFNNIDEIYNYNIYDFSINMYSLEYYCREALVCEYLEDNREEFAYTYYVPYGNMDLKQMYRKLSLSRAENVYEDSYAFSNGFYDSNSDFALNWLIACRELFRGSHEEGFNLCQEVLLNVDLNNHRFIELDEDLANGRLYLDSEGLAHYPDKSYANVYNIDINDRQSGNVQNKSIDKIKKILINDFGVDNDKLYNNNQESEHAEGVSIYLNGYQINATRGAHRICYSVYGESNKVVESGLIFGLSKYATFADMTVNSINKDVYSFKSTEKGKVNLGDNSDDYQSYVMTMPFINSKDYFDSEMMVRAYAKLDNGQYIYSKVDKTSVYGIAAALYEYQEVPTKVFFDYLYNNIISLVNSDYKMHNYFENIYVE
ncbi:MAG: hypothetical protein K6G88_03350 [Lachnospiraceae bacterium]|nr:hypothetical protein [Lachnospiraceae bacterium]